MNAGIFVLDLDRCTGCSACVVACTTENRTTEAWRVVHTFNRQRFPSSPVIHYSLACNHCLEPTCLENCPAAAFHQDEATGAVLLDGDRCMGCRYCSWVCPYDAPRFNSSDGTMEKCTWCRDRLVEGLDPACVTACPVDALRFTDSGERTPIKRPGFPETGLEPSLQILGHRREAPPKMTAAPEEGDRATERELSWSGLRSEWSLWLFTTIAAFLVGWFVARISGGSWPDLPVFAAAGILGMAISALHLGRIRRIHRALFNLRGSWVSREVLFFSLFFGLACVLPSAPDLPPVTGWATTVLGLAALFSMDMVYRVPGQHRAAVPHSAMASFTVVLVVAALLGEATLLLPVACLKLLLYLGRRHPAPGRRSLAAVRIAAGLALPCLAVLTPGLVPATLALAGVAAGELIDRAEFYAGLDFPTPTRQIAHDLERRAAAA